MATKIREKHFSKIIEHDDYHDDNDDELQ